MTADGVDVVVEGADADERNDGLREVTRAALAMMPFGRHDDAPIDESISSQNAGRPLIGLVAFHRLHLRRDRPLPVQGGLDHYLLQLLTSDSRQGDFTHGYVSAVAGDICIFDLAQLPKSQAEAGSTVSVSVSRKALEKAIGSRNLHGVVLKAHGSMTPLIAAVLRGMCSLSAPLPDMQAMAAQDALIILLSAVFKSDVQAEASGDSSLGMGLRQRIVEFITSNVHVLELSPNSLCRRFKVSRAHLYRAFANDGGVAKVLRDIRLDAAYRELTGTARTSRSITEIAHSLGFSSGNQLLRSFRARFGMTPSEARASEQG